MQGPILYRVNIIITYYWVFKRNCKRNFKWSSVQRRHCPIYNGTNETLIWSKKCLIITILHCLLKARNAQIIFAKKPKMKINSLNKKHIDI